MDLCIYYACFSDGIRRSSEQGNISELSSVVVTSPKLTLMATLIGEVHSNFGSRNSVCRLLRIFIAQNINIAY